MPFELKTSSGIVSLVWNTWAMHQFCYLNGTQRDTKGDIIPIAISKLMEIYTSENLTLKHVITMLQAGSDAAGKVIDEREACRLIDEGGGLQSGDSQIMSYIQYTIKEMLPKLPEDKQQTEEKKS